MIKIKHRFNGSVLFKLETNSVKICLEAAVRAKTNLGDADLRDVNLRDANLRNANLRNANLGDADLGDADLRDVNLIDANLRNANLRNANLRNANLIDANLIGANLIGANLIGAYLIGADLGDVNLIDANLRNANLRNANLIDANLIGADLRDVNLIGANLIGANLIGAYLGNAKGIHPARCTPLLMLLDQPGKIRAYKLVNARGEGLLNGGLKYEIGQNVTVEDANTDVNVQCGAGVNVATLDWCMKGWVPGYRILIIEFTAQDIAAIPTVTDGKFRLHRCAVVGEKDLKEIGLVPNAR